MSKQQTNNYGWAALAAASQSPIARSLVRDRGRRYLTPRELEKLTSEARNGRWGHRDATLIRTMARHGLRVSEAIGLRWDQIDFAKGYLHVERLKGGVDSVHTMQGDEIRDLRRLQRLTTGPWVFVTERGGPMTRSNVQKMIEATALRAGLPHIHPHELRHTCGYLLADEGHDTRRIQHWLGHSDIKHTAHYTALSAEPFKDFWRGKR